jgi:crotonobetainyl-CoA:carnitine CoA-transferase CaiB-like acyl-CoA transferase
MILGDLGAEVIKVEAPYEPGAPPIGKGVSPHPQDERSERVAAYHPLNRNKKSIVLNLRLEEAREVFYKLVKNSDVILEGFRPGTVKRLGVDYETVEKINPEIIYCSISGYGQDGPYQFLPGHDINYISISGALGIIGEPSGPPVIPLNLVADYAGGALHAVIGILAALLAREKTGRGQYVDIAMADGAISLLSVVAFDYFCNGVILKRGEGMLNGGASFYSPYQTKDEKYISIGCIEPHFWGNLCRELGREDLIPYQQAEGEKREEIVSYFRDVFRTKTRDEWFDLLKGKNIPIAKVYSIDEVFTDPQVLHRRMAVEIEHPTLGKVKQVGIPIKLSDTPGSIRNLAPLLGEHTEGILQNLGYDREQIESLRKAGAIV